MRGCGGARGGDTKASTYSTLILVHLNPKSSVMSQCPHCWWRPPCSGAGVWGEPANGAGHPSAALDAGHARESPSVPSRLSAGAWAAPAGEQSHEEDLAPDPRPGSLCAAGEVTGWATLGTGRDLKNCVSETHSRLQFCFCGFAPQVLSGWT